MKARSSSTPPRLQRVTVCLCAAATLLYSTAHAEVTILRGSRIYVSPDVPPLDGSVVVLTDDKITAVGPTSLPLPEGARESSCNGGVITAGFQNSHVHLTGEQFANARSAKPDALTKAIVEMFTRYGFTTITDTGSVLANTMALKARIDKGEVLGPRILTAGTPLYPPAGIPFYLQDTLPKSILDTLPQPTTADAAVKLVADNIAGGADGTKLFIATPQKNQPVKRMPHEIALAATEETHRLKKLAMTHPTDYPGIQAAVAENIDIVLHTTFGDKKLWPEKLVREMVRKKISLVPTLQLWPFELKKGQASEEERKKLLAPTITQLKMFSAAGGQVLFGTDVGYITEYDPTVEYELMSKAELTPMQILTSLTVAPSTRWNESMRRGRIAKGMDADLVVLDADPAKGAANFAKVKCTIRSGKVIYSAN